MIRKNSTVLAKCAYDTWIVPINTYYHSLYLKLMNQYINLLLKQKKYLLTCSICCRALSIDHFDEDLHYYFIYALYKAGKQSIAIEQYNRTASLFLRKYNMKPSERFTNLYKMIANTAGPQNTNLFSILNTLTEKGSEKKGGDSVVNMYFSRKYSTFLYEHVNARQPPSVYACLQLKINPKEFLRQPLLKKQLLPSCEIRGGDLVLKRILIKFDEKNNTITKATGNLIPINDYKKAGPF